ncbi:MAG: Ig-like domain-containing protein, partial [Anaerolineaceae bacterium]|nr:Ig-like domain-containing protein [Anaerolineaceae bacterium]
MNTTKKWMIGVILSLGITLAAAPALAQSELTLTIHRDFGFGNGAQVRGAFSLNVTSTSSLQSVTYLIDGQVMQEVKAAPFKFSFNTGKYPSGWHDLSATAITTDGRMLQSQLKHLNFLSAEQEKTAMTGTIFPILGGLVGIVVVVALAQFVLFRTRKRAAVPPGAQRSYGMSGGAICPRCKRPFPLHWYAMNAGITTKLDTCENCGRFGLFHRASREALLKAEQDELRQAQPQVSTHELSEEEKLKQQVNSSRYEE